jgi:hypothetical protein
LAPACQCGFGTATVSETVSESTERVIENSGELRQILLETLMKPAILLAMNR